MIFRRMIGTAVILIWFITLGFVCGPLRWEFAHTYRNLINGFEDSLPVLTTVLGLPVLGIGDQTFMSIFVVVVLGGITWLGPATLLVGVWRFPNREKFSDWLLFGGSLYVAIILLFTILLAVSFWLPFSLLWSGG